MLTPVKLLLILLSSPLAQAKKKYFAMGPRSITSFLLHRQLYQPSNPSESSPRYSGRANIRADPLSIALLAFKTDVSGTSQPSPPPPIAEMVEVSFIHACMDLSSGRVTVLKGFLAAVASAYAAGTNVDALEAEVQLYDASVRTAGRELAPEEVALRRAWIDVGYATLWVAGRRTAATGGLDTLIEGEGKEGAKNIASAIFEARQSGRPLGSVSPEEVVGAGAAKMSKEEKAVLMLKAKASDTMLTVIEEEEAASGGDKDEKSVPRPKIPGTF